MPDPQALGVVSIVVPVHDEQELLARCLRAVEASVGALLERGPGLRVRTVVVLDACRDRSAEIAAEFAVETVKTDDRCVGAARRVGIDHAAFRAGSVPPSRHWLACTDADSEVPTDWLRGQVRAAEAGARLVLGGVQPDPEDMPPPLLRVWCQQIHDIETSVHGANLGVRLDDYLGVGGFPAVAEHEDVRLVEALLTSGITPHRGLPVLTSGRTRGRTPGGFAGYLSRLSGVGPARA